MLTNDNLSHYIGCNLRQIRLIKGLSQKDVADALGVSYQQIQKYEQGKNKIRVEQLIKLAEFFDVPVTSFFGEPKAASSNIKLSRSHSELIHSFDRLSPLLQKKFLSLVKELSA